MVMRFVFDDVFGQPPLREQRIGGDVTACDVTGIEPRHGHANFIGLFFFVTTLMI
jgi:hypothetical protein